MAGLSTTARASSPSSISSSQRGREEKEEEEAWAISIIISTWQSGCIQSKHPSAWAAAAAGLCEEDKRSSACVTWRGWELASSLSLSLSHHHVVFLFFIFSFCSSSSTSLLGKQGGREGGGRICLCLTSRGRAWSRCFDSVVLCNWVLTHVNCAAWCHVTPHLIHFRCSRFDVEALRFHVARAASMVVPGALGVVMLVVRLGWERWCGMVEFYWVLAGDQGKKTIRTLWLLKLSELVM